LYLTLAAFMAASGLWHFASEVLAYSRGQSLDMPLYAQAAMRHWQGLPVYIRAEDLLVQYKPGAIVFKFPPPYLFVWLPWFDASGTWPQGFQSVFMFCSGLIYLGTFGLVSGLLWRTAQQSGQGGMLSDTSSFLLIQSFVLLAVCWFVPVLYVFGASSAENLMLFIAVLALTLMSRWPLLAGLLLAYPACMKLYPVFLLLYPLMTRQWTVVAGFALGCVIAGLASIGIFGWEENYFYFSRIFPLLLSEPILDDWTEPLRHATGNLSIVRVLTGYSLVFPSRDITWLNAVRLPLIAVTASLLWWRVRQPETAQWVSLLGSGLVIVTMLMCLPNLFYPYFIWLVFPMAVLAAYLLHHRQTGGACVVLLILSPLLIKDTWIVGLAVAAGLDAPSAEVAASAEAMGQWHYLWQHHFLLALLMTGGRLVPFVPYALWLMLAWNLWRKS
jgi:hypothetical protein